MDASSWWWIKDDRYWSRVQLNGVKGRHGIETGELIKFLMDSTCWSLIIDTIWYGTMAQWPTLPVAQHYRGVKTRPSTSQRKENPAALLGKHFANYQPFVCVCVCYCRFSESVTAKSLTQPNLLLIKPMIVSCSVFFAHLLVHLQAQHKLTWNNVRP